MVEYNVELDQVFATLADATRRDIFRRVTGSEQTIGEIAEHYAMSLAAVSKHLKIMEKARLIRKRKEGRLHYVTARPETLHRIESYLADYETLWNYRFDVLDKLLKEEQ
jgi:DNA-binding transcriptional ArsR family regulator